ncbi:MAG TPA: DUF308 domain-containing protein [Atribacteraceae bacterium]|nr:DUF308 domain-containing protein [Atribacteraceae bacterium]
MYERTILSSDWMALVFKGVLILLFGILTLVSPGLTAIVPLIFLGLVLLFNGIMFLMLASRPSFRRWFYLTEGVINLITGFLVFFRPGVAFLTIIWSFGIWLLVSGAFTLLAAFDFSQSISNPGRLFQVINGVLVLIFSWLSIKYPLSGALVLSPSLGLFAILVGTGLLLSCYYLHRTPRGIPKKTLKKPF